ncbi:MAG: type II secretion system F family protein [bacterium]
MNWWLKFISSLVSGCSNFYYKSLSEIRSAENKKLTKTQISRFCAQLHLLLSSGVPLLEALSIVKNILKLTAFDNLIEKVTDGCSLAEALQRHFPPLVVSSIASAEMSGSLDEVLARLAKHYETRAETESKIKSALIYPSFVITLCFGTLFVLLVFILPGFRQLFADLDADLPLFTELLISFGEGFSKIWYLPIVGSLSLAAYLPRYKQNEKNVLKLDGWAMKLKFVSRSLVIQALRTLGSLLQGGVPILPALDSCVNSTHNKFFQIKLRQIKEAVENGESLSTALQAHDIFPVEAIQMIRVGENSGKLAEMLISIADFYEQEWEVAIKRFTTMLEPVLTLFVGLVVGVIAIAMFLPMINMISRMQ